MNYLMSTIPRPGSAMHLSTMTVFASVNGRYASVASAAISSQPCRHSVSIDPIKPQCTADKDGIAHIVRGNRRESNKAEGKQVERNMRVSRTDRQVQNILYMEKTLHLYSE